MSDIDLQKIKMLIQFFDGTNAVWNALTDVIPNQVLVYSHTPQRIIKCGNGVDTYADLPIFLDIDNLTPLNHTHSPSQVGLDQVSNYPIATKEQAEAMSTNLAYMTPGRLAEAAAKNWRVATDIEASSADIENVRMSPRATAINARARMSEVFGVLNVQESTGWQTIFVPATCFRDPINEVLTASDGGDNNDIFLYNNFLPDLNSYTEFDFLIPDSAISSTSLKYRLFLYAPTATEDITAVMQTGIKSYGHEYVPTPFGSETGDGSVVSVDIPLGQLAVSPITDVIVTGNVIQNAIHRCAIGRLGTHASDTNTNTIGVVGIEIYFETAKVSDIVSEG